MVTDDNKDKPLMVFETDDAVFVYSSEGRSLCGMAGEVWCWFAKQHLKRMLQEEMVFYKNSTPGDQQRTGKFQLQSAQTEQNTLMDTWTYI